MILKQYCVCRNAIPFKSQKPGENLIFGTLLETFSIFNSVLLKICYFEVQSCLWCHCDVIHWTFILILVCMYGKRRPIAILWYQLDISGGLVFKLGSYLIQGFSIIFPCRPQRAEDSSKIDVWGPNDHHFPMYFYVYWSWQRAKQVWSVGRIWPTGHHLRRPDLIHSLLPQHF